MKLVSLGEVSWQFVLQCSFGYGPASRRVMLLEEVHTISRAPESNPWAGVSKDFPFNVPMDSRKGTSGPDGNGR